MYRPKYVTQAVGFCFKAFFPFANHNKRIHCNFSNLTYLNKYNERYGGSIDVGSVLYLIPKIGSFCKLGWR